MNLHEYQGKALFAEYGLPVSVGQAVDTPEAAEAAAREIGGDKWVVKAQVHAGGRGKAGGVKLVDSPAEARAFAENWLGKNLVTYQTDANGQPVSKILVETCTDIADELYLGAVVDRSSRRIVFMASTEGGVEIENITNTSPLIESAQICLFDGALHANEELPMLDYYLEWIEKSIDSCCVKYAEKLSFPKTS